MAMLFRELSLSAPLVQDLRRMNPWWEGKPLPALPATRRHLVGQIHRRLELRLAPVVVVRGPLEVGKTTAQLQVVQDLLGRGVPPRNVFRVQADELPELASLTEPILRLVDWYEAAVLGGTLNEAARRGEPTYLLFDEVQRLAAWGPQLKSLVDSSTTQALVAGSSALRTDLGRDGLAGRVSTLEAGALSLTEIAAFHGLDAAQPFLGDAGLEPLAQREVWEDLRAFGAAHAEARDEAFRRFSSRGGYPLAHQRADAPWSHLAEQLAESVVRRTLHDLRAGERGEKRDPALLEEVFRLACRYVGQAPGAELLARETQRALAANVGPQRVRQYLRFLGDSLLVRLVEPFELRLKRRRESPKICLADPSLRASWLKELVPLDPSELAREPPLQPLAGHLAQSVVGAALSTIPHLELAHLPAHGGEPAADFVLTVGTRRIPIEVKYQRRLDPLRDTEGLRTFLEKAVNNAPFGILLSQVDDDAILDPRIVSLPLASFLLLR
jgi:predicted AAA+ superfamily ATPase